MLNVFSRLLILADYLEVEWTDIKTAAVAAAKDERTTAAVHAFMKPPTPAAKPGRLNGSMSGELVRDPMHADIIFEATRALGERGGKPITEAARLDADLAEFLSFCSVRPERVLEHLGANEQALFRYLDSQIALKEEFLPDRAIVRLDGIRDEFGKFAGDYRVHRRVSKPKGGNVLADELLSIRFDGSPHVVYVDHRGHKHRGLAFFSKDRFVSLVFSAESKQFDLRYTVVTFFLSELQSEDYFATLGRSAFFDRKTYAYKAICTRLRPGEVSEPCLRKFKLHDVRYHHAIENLVSKENFGGGSFVYDYADALEELRKGEQLEKILSSRFTDQDTEIELEEIQNATKAKE